MGTFFFFLCQIGLISSSGKRRTPRTDSHLFLFYLLYKTNVEVIEDGEVGEQDRNQTIQSNQFQKTTLCPTLTAYSGSIRWIKMRQYGLKSHGDIVIGVNSSQCILCVSCADKHASLVTPAATPLSLIDKQKILSQQMFFCVSSQM